jgi:hypothetical protein
MNNRLLLADKANPSELFNEVRAFEETTLKFLLIKRIIIKKNYLLISILL